MVNLRLSASELMYQRSQFYESQSLNGVRCLIYKIEESYTSSHDLYGDVMEDVSYLTDPFETFLTFDTHPTVKTLKSLGWYIDEKTLPVIAYIPLLYKSDTSILRYTPSIDDKIVLPSNQTVGDDVLRDSETFLIKKLVGQGYPDVVYWVANLVPLRRDY